MLLSMFIVNAFILILSEVAEEKERKKKQSKALRSLLREKQSRKSTR